MALEMVKREALDSHNPHDSLRSRLYTYHHPNYQLHKLHKILTRKQQHIINQAQTSNGMIWCSLSGPPSCATASTKRSWSSTVHRRRGLGSVVRTRPESPPCWPWTTHGRSFGDELTTAPGFLEQTAAAGNILFPLSAPLLNLSLSLWRSLFPSLAWSLSDLLPRIWDEIQEEQGIGFAPARRPRRTV